MNNKIVASSIKNLQLGTAILNIKDALHNNHYKKYSAVVLSYVVLFSVSVRVLLKIKLSLGSLLTIDLYALLDVL